MPKLPRVGSKKLVSVLIKIGFVPARSMRGSHLVLRHADKRQTTIPMHGAKEIPLGTLMGILRDINISREEFIEFFKL